MYMFTFTSKNVIDEKRPTKKCMSYSVVSFVMIMTYPLGGIARTQYRKDKETTTIKVFIFLLL